MKRLTAIILTVVILLCGCQTRIEYVYPELPVFTPVRPARPTLAEVEGNIPLDAIRNTVKLISYAEMLETYADTWEGFYRELYDDMKDRKDAK